MVKLRSGIPLGLLLIIAFYIFGAVALLVFLFIDPVQAANTISRAHGLPASTGSWIVPLFAGLALLVAYGLFSLSRWGYRLALLYLASFGIVSGYLLGAAPNSIYLGNPLWSLIVILYLILVRKRFNRRLSGTA